MEDTNTKILFINRHQNNAWVRTDKGIFVTPDGSVYEFDLIGKNFRSREHFSQNDVIKALTNVLHDAKPIKTIEKKKILQAYNLINEIDKNSEMLLSQFANDAVINEGGCPHGNTAKLINSFIKGVTDAGHQAEVISLIKSQVKQCLGCYSCIVSSKINSSATMIHLYQYSMKIFLSFKKIYDFLRNYSLYIIKIL